MTDLWAIAERTIADPIVLGLGIIVLGWFSTRFFSGNYPLSRALARVVLLLILTIVLLRGGIVPYRRLTATGTPFHDTIVAAMKIAWWLWAAWLLVGFLRIFLVLERRPHEGKLIQDLLAGLIYLTTGFAIIAYVFDLPVQGLIATSGAIAIILGLVLQSTLSDVFSGVVLNFSRPYRPDDWIKLDGGTEGRVIEMNWRATHILTAQRDLAIVPNSAIAKSKIVNVSFPAGVHGLTITVQVDARTPPASGAAILGHAVLNCRAILATPAPAITVKTINAAYVEFEIAFFVSDLGSAGEVQSDLFDHIFRHLAAAGTALAPALGFFDRSRRDDATPRPTTDVETLLGLVAIFATLTGDERSALVAKLKRASYDQGDALLKPGAVLQSLFIIGSGVVSATVRDEYGGDSELLRLGPGDHFGEAGLLTGAASRATILALTPVVTYELSKQTLTAIIEARPQVAHDLSRALTQRLAAGRSIAATELAGAMPKRSLSTWFLERIHKLFELAGEP
jgi:small-conductance mechanosensitive channel/CRP-like cAMP-binding protein